MKTKTIKIGNRDKADITDLIKKALATAKRGNLRMGRETEYTSPYFSGMTWNVTMRRIGKCTYGMKVWLMNLDLNEVDYFFSLSREPRVAVKLYDTYVVRATGTPSDYTLDIDAGYFSATTRSRVNAALDGLGVALTLRSRDGDPAYFDGEGREIVAVRRAFCPSFHVVGGKVVLS